MNQLKTRPTYLVGVNETPGDAGTLRITFVPSGKPLSPMSSHSAEHVYMLDVEGHDETAVVSWVNPPRSVALRARLEMVAKERTSARQMWFEKLRKLVDTVKGWAEDLGWSTKVVGKKMEDSEIGNYKAPALVLQCDSVRLFLEPISRVAPGKEGIVDLYLMPSYDDIASLYYYSDRWNIHYVFPCVGAVANIREAQPQALTKLALRKVFDEMKRNAG